MRGLLAGMKYGHGQVLDGLIRDGLWDVYNDIHMVRGALVRQIHHNFVWIL